MYIKRPTLEHLKDTALSLGIHLSDEELSAYNNLLQSNFDAYDIYAKAQNLGRQ